jgi:thiamine biosynthesis lipoprotein
MQVVGEPDVQWEFEAIGTHWWIGVYGPLDAAQLEAVRHRIALRIERFDATYSRFRSDSVVTKISQQAGEFRLPADSRRLFAWYRKLYTLTRGAVTPLVGQLLSDAGYDAAYSLQPRELRTPPSWDEAMTFRSGILHTTQPVLLDVGAAGKGYLVDIVGGILQAAGITRYCVDAGGDIRFMHPADSMRVGLEHPDHPGQLVGVATLQNAALCGSAGNRRAWKGYHHIMDPFTRSSPRHLKAVWAVAADAMAADGITTALYFTPAEELRRQVDFEYVLVHGDDSATHSPGFPGELFTRAVAVGGQA